MLGCVWRVLAIYRTATQQLEAHGRGVDDTQGDDVRHILYKLGLTGRFRRIPRPGRECFTSSLVTRPGYFLVVAAVPHGVAGLVFNGEITAKTDGL